MNIYDRGELAADIAEKFDISKAEAQRILDFGFERIAQKLGEGNQVRLHELANLSLQHKAEKTGSTSLSGTVTEYTIPEHLKIKASFTTKFKKVCEAASKEGLPVR